MTPSLNASIDDSVKLETELDKMSIDQLHNQIIEFNKSSLELKKWLTSLLIAAVGLYFTLSGEELTNVFLCSSVAVMALLTGVVFIMDVDNYYFQRRLRFVQQQTRNTLLVRLGAAADNKGMGIPLPEWNDSKERQQARRYTFRFYGNLFVIYFIFLLGGLLYIRYFKQ